MGVIFSLFSQILKYRWNYSHANKQWTLLCGVCFQGFCSVHQSQLWKFLNVVFSTTNWFAFLWLWKNHPYFSKLKRNKTAKLMFCIEKSSDKTCCNFCLLLLFCHFLLDIPTAISHTRHDFPIKILCPSGAQLRLKKQHWTCLHTHSRNMKLLCCILVAISALVSATTEVVPKEILEEIQSLKASCYVSRT